MLRTALPIAPLAMALTLSAASTGAGADAEILECIRSNTPRGTLVQQLEFRSEDRYEEEGNPVREVRILKADLYWKRFADDLARVIAYFQEPLDIRGARILLIEKPPENEIHIYAPALGRVRPLTASRIAASVHNTDFSYEDVERLYGMFRQASIERQRDTELDGRLVWVLSSSTAEGSDSAYERVVSFVDKDSCVVVKMELYGPGSQLRKVMTVPADAIRQTGDIWIAHEIRMQDVRDGTATTLSVRGVDTQQALPDALFEPDRLDQFSPR
jgi:hypothetical protein